MHALHQEILPPSGIEFVTSLRLTPSTLKQQQPTSVPNVTVRHEFAARALCNVVVARSNLLRIFELRQEPAPIAAAASEDNDGKARKGTEAVEEEVRMDEQGEGFVNIDKLSGVKNHVQTVTRFVFVREHKLHGIVTGMEAVKVMASIEDKLDRLLISFKDAKIALLEWSDAVHDLTTVSIHTYERAPQVMTLDAPGFKAELRADPLSRCVALSLPKEALAILPFYQSQAEIDMVDQETSQARDIPYSPSFILDLPISVDKSILNIIDFVFLPGFHNPTIAVLFRTELTWTGRLKEYKDTVKLIMFTLDIVSQSYPVIASVSGLPHDCISLLPCASSVGGATAAAVGVVIMSSNSLIYVDQTGRRVTLPFNGWASRVSDLPYPTPDDPTRAMALEGARCVFVDERTIFVITKDGTVYPVEVVAEGKTVSKLVVAPALAKTTIPAAVRTLQEDMLFIGSTVGPSMLLKAARVEEEVDEDQEMAAAPAVVAVNDGMDLDDEDEDIYGPYVEKEPVNGLANGNVATKKKTRTVIHLSMCDHLPAHGPISDIAFSVARNGDRPVPELVAATGIGMLGGFTLFQRDLPTRTKRRLHAIGGARGLWSLPIRQTVKTSSYSFERVSDPHKSDIDTLLMSTDANPSPGLSRLALRSVKNDLSITNRIPGTTIGAAPFFQRTAILHVMTNAIRVLEPDATERQIIKDVDGNNPRPRIRACSILDPFVLIFREDDSIGLFIDTGKGKIRRKDMSPMGDKSSKYLSGCFFTDTTGLFENNFLMNQPPNSATVDTTTLQAAVSARSASQWLLLVRPQGVMEIWSLPKLSLAFSTPLVNNLPYVMSDSHDPPAASLPQEPPRKPQDQDVEQILVAPLGETSLEPHLLVFLRSGQLAIYQVLPLDQPAQAPSSPTATRSSTLNVKFVKMMSKTFPLSKPEEGETSIIAEQKKVLRLFIPFSTVLPSGKTFTGVFLTGKNPSWIVASDKSGAHVYPSGHTTVHAFTPCSLWEWRGDFLVYSEEGPSLLEWIADYQIEGPLPSRSVPRGRAYSNVVYEPSTSLIVAASTLQAKFASFDEDGNKVWEPDAPNIMDPLCECSTLELISPDLWVTMDGYEFATNEFVNAVACVTLETSSTEAGSKDFIAVGTSINRGEDLAVKGCTYIFEIVEVVPDPSLAPKRWYKLRLRCKDDAKGPVTALSGFNGYLVSSMGQKIFVRAFDLDERLVGVAFMDVGVYVTSLRTLKNLLLISDAVKSVSFVAFQEDPYKLVLLGKDLHHHCVSNADFFFTEEELALITYDEEGIVRSYEYNPQDPESHDGRHLLLRSEFHSQAEYRTSLLVARRADGEAVIPYARLICGATNGSLATLTPTDDLPAKRFLLLQGQLTRNIQHAAGLNPKAFRIVRNDYVSKPLSKGILDGSLLVHFEGLPIIRQEEMTRQIGTEKTVILRDWVSFTCPW